ncbi:unnamed protein product [Citrullus colocynthis]|uniref:Uncharacterized protein n=1 Tax=Citrullus colocynthis TaxID=252529 RepID=A0ABP0XS11_9ROSI
MRRGRSEKEETRRFRGSMHSRANQGANQYFHVLEWMEKIKWGMKTVGPNIPSMYADGRIDNDREFVANGSTTVGKRRRFLWRLGVLQL